MVAMNSVAGADWAWAAASAKGENERWGGGRLWRVSRFLALLSEV
jgi:hypothetical protein